MASAEAKVVIIVLLILAVGFFYMNARDRITGGYASVQKTVDTEERKFAAEESYQATEIAQTLQIEQQSKPQKEEPTKEVSLQERFPSAINPCSDNIPPQIQTLVRGAC